MGLSKGTKFSVVVKQKKDEPVIIEKAADFKALFDNRNGRDAKAFVKNGKK